MPGASRIFYNLCTWIVFQIEIFDHSVQTLNTNEHNAMKVQNFHQGTYILKSVLSCGGVRVAQLEQETITSILCTCTKIKTQQRKQLDSLKLKILNNFYVYLKTNRTVSYLGLI